ncbi:hypothetical protein Cgig2_023472 [Carnegiea gigantea]|uniref:STAS domain-containing protein n=1 Tax=Carnegiea gigantea TaxID=171969 RepID=A0A9Q1JQD3_9CARY|nr:hypothetical protein Cgig2_023472 [Carnegiea gigantea]
MDFNPWGAFTLPLLFEWEELERSEKAEEAIDFRIAESQCTVRPGLKTAVPYDYIDTSPGSGWDEFLRNADENLHQQLPLGYLVDLLLRLGSNQVRFWVDYDDWMSTVWVDSGSNYCGLGVYDGWSDGNKIKSANKNELGWLIRFISHAVISGFTTASTIVIALSQAKYFLGYSIVRSSEIIPFAKSIIAGVHQFSWATICAGIFDSCCSIDHEALGKEQWQGATGPLTGVLLGIAVVKLFRPSAISVVGEIPQGLPGFSVPKGFAYFTSLIPTAFLITGVAILESVGIAKALAAKNGYDLDSNQELFGLGVANISTSFFSAYPTTGSFSRSAANHESGAKTGLAGIISGIIMGCALLFLTPLFVDIPQMDYDEAILLWRVDKKDVFLWTITFLATLFLSIEIGVLVGVGVSLAFVIHESANLHMAVLGRLPGTTIYRNIEQYPEAYTYNGIVIVRVDAPIYFANISYI